MLTGLPEATIHYGWLDLPESSSQCFEKALRDLAIWLSEPPICALISIDCIPRPWLDAVYRAWHNASDVVCAVADLTYMAAESQVNMPRLVVGCTNQHPFAQKAVAHVPWALWGARCGCFALCYNCDNPYSVWHETLHTLGAKDCYDDDKPEELNCNCPGCLMQYAPDEQTVGQSPRLCEANQKRVREKIKEIQAEQG